MGWQDWIPHNQMGTTSCGSNNSRQGLPFIKIGSIREMAKCIRKRMQLETTRSGAVSQKYFISLPPTRRQLNVKALRCHFVIWLPRGCRSQGNKLWQPVGSCKCNWHCNCTGAPPATYHCTLPKQTEARGTQDTQIHSCVYQPPGLSFVNLRGQYASSSCSNSLFPLIIGNMGRMRNTHSLALMTHTPRGLANYGPHWPRAYFLGVK